MQDTQVIDNDFSVGLNTPSSNTLEALAKAGYRSIVSLLPENEGTPSLPLTEEESYARSLGLSFYHFPVSMAEMSPEMINRFRAFVAEIPTPTYLHCATGKRSGALIMMHVAVKNGLSGDAALNQASAMGFQCDSEDLNTLVKQYVDSSS